MATEYISREAVIFEILSDPTDAHYPSWYTEKLKQIPTADVRPVVHGRWIPMTYIKELTENEWPNCRWEKAIEPDSVDGLMCSECGEIFDVADARNFCTQCGADMKGKQGGTL